MALNAFLRSTSRPKMPRWWIAKVLGGRPPRPCRRPLKRFVAVPDAWARRQKPRPIKY